MTQDKQKLLYVLFLLILRLILLSFRQVSYCINSGPGEVTSKIKPSRKVEALYRILIVFIWVNLLSG